MRRWLTVVVLGFIVILLTLIASTLVIADKEHFGWMVTSSFLPIISSGVIAGGLAMVVGTLMLPARKTWRGIVLILWGLVAATSPLFGFLFLMPWGLLAITSPLVIWILVTLRRTAVAAPLPATAA